MITLHIKQDLPGLGPDIKKCTNCGTRLWLASDGIWTDSVEIYDNPPEDYINCNKKVKENG